MRVSPVRAALGPSNLFVLATAIIAGLVIALWLLPVGIVAYIALIILTIMDRGAAVQPLSPAVRKPQPTAFQPQLDTIAQIQARIAGSVAAVDGPLRSALERVTAQVDTIVQESYTLADKGQTIVSYLQSTNLHELNVQLSRVEAQVQAATDPELRRQYEETRSAVAERLKNAQALGTYRERISAQLDNITANLDNVLAETVRLRAAPAAGSTTATDSVSSRLSDMRADMDALGHMLDSALTGVN